jgi:hypothetical protein
MNHMFLLIVAFAVGVFVGYKYPHQVEQGVETSKKLFNDVKDKFTKGSPPKGPSEQ